ncbi:MAG: MBL fold metallo-hydrolase [Planctomycetota bacterium]
MSANAREWPVGAAVLNVLASGSSGNCSVLRVRTTSSVRTVLIDAGLSPMRTRKLLDDVGVRADEVDDVLLTHLDQDHCHAGWRGALSGRAWRATLRLHKRHLGRAERMGLLSGIRACEPFAGEAFDMGPARVAPHLLPHDELGVAAFRIDTPAASLGFATDLGRAERPLLDHLRGCGLLAIESNYCPRMQRDSGRPVFVQNRITGGAGHLSNEESAEAVGSIAPAGGALLLHLSRDCNSPERARGVHASHGFGVRLSGQHDATGWVEVPPARNETEPVGVIEERSAPRQMGLFATPAHGAEGARA